MVTKERSEDECGNGRTHVQEPDDAQELQTHPTGGSHPTVVKEVRVHESAHAPLDLRVNNGHEDVATHHDAAESLSFVP